MSTQRWEDDIEFDSDGFEIFKAVEPPTPATVEIYNSETEKLSSPVPASPVLTVSVVQEASIMVVSASPTIGTLRCEWPQRMTLQKGDVLSVKRAAKDDNHHHPAPDIEMKVEETTGPAGLDKKGKGKSRRNIDVVLSEAGSSTSGNESTLALDGSSSSTPRHARPDRFAHFRDNRFLRASRHPQKDAVRSPLKKPRLGANLNQIVGLRRVEAQTLSKLEMWESDQENQAPVEDEDLWQG